MWAAAGEDPHRRGPAGQLVATRARAQQRCQVGDVHFFDPALAVRAALIRAGVIGATLLDLAGRVDGDLPGLLGDQPQRGPLRSPSTQPTE